MWVTVSNTSNMLALTCGHFYSASKYLSTSYLIESVIHKLFKQTHWTVAAVCFITAMYRINRKDMICILFTHTHIDTHTCTCWYAQTVNSTFQWTQYLWVSLSTLLPMTNSPKKLLTHRWRSAGVTTNLLWLVRLGGIRLGTRWLWSGCVWRWSLVRH